VTHPALRDLLQSLARQTSFQEVSRELAAGAGGQFRLSGLTLTAKALYLTLLWQIVNRPVVALVDGSKQAETLTALTATFFDLIVPGREQPQLVPALDVLPHQGLSPHSGISQQRVSGLLRLARHQAPLTIAPAGSVLLRTGPAEYYRQLPVQLKLHEDIPMEDLLAHLRATGYEQREPVEMEGEFSVRGGILDVFPAGAERPVRVEFFGDTVESLRTFDVETQRSVLKIGDVTLLPLLECPRGEDRAPGWEFRASAARGPAHWLFDLAPKAVVVMDEPEQVLGAAGRLWKRLEDAGPAADIPPERIYFTVEELQARLDRAQRLDLRELDLEPGAPRISSRASIPFHGNMQVAVAEARTMVEQGNRVVFFAATNGELERLADIFSEYALPFQMGIDPSEASAPYLAQRVYHGESASVFLGRGQIRRGVTFPDARIAIIGSEDLFDRGAATPEPAVRASNLGAFAADIGDLKPGDHVVHATHGIGQFLGVRELVQGDQRGDFMLIEYTGGAKLYVPLSRLDLIQKYRGAGDSSPQLDKLGGVTWEKTKSKVKARMLDMAEELLRLYAERKMAEGFAYSPDSNWQREFEDSFEFTPTKDQVSAVEDIKRDMESPSPMDRLLCGDVGFGKTEVAMRAAFKALGDGKQVAVLTPTTVLCLQHFETFKRRFAAFPVRVEMFSRFRDKKELKTLGEELAEGKIDLAIGTHRLLSSDIQFKDLGLLVVDEEQRFGVRHKERLKQLRKSVDVLAMSATPIPRTLHMSLLGVRDLSVIETPPKDRLAINTVVAKFNPDLIKTAIEQELARGGQVYFLHNRVESIWSRAASIQEMIPGVRIGVGHGQMEESALEKVILGFMHHEFDVFVCTTIVENGIDIPLANTMIVENAERYGLSELYQLRGRVGRSNRRAYAYLLVPADAELTDVARKRLAALREFSDLGAGFKIAALDLELRGAGNLLGGEQHGHIDAVGYDVYMSLLEQSVRELRGERVAPEIHTTITLGLDLRIPAGYIGDEAQRLRAYKKIADVAGEDQARKVREELVDRYGPVPEAVDLLIRFSAVKARAERLGIESVEKKTGALHVKFHPETPLDPMLLMELVQTVRGAQFAPNGVLRLPLEPGAATTAGLIAALEGHTGRLEPLAEKAAEG